MEVFDKVVEFLSSPYGLVIVGFVVEFVFRKFPTKEPKSLFLAVKKVLAVVGKVADVLEALVDKLIAQNIK
jgi:hypothetical protein